MGTEARCCRFPRWTWPNPHPHSACTLHKYLTGMEFQSSKKTFNGLDLLRES